MGDETDVVTRLPPARRHTLNYYAAAARRSARDAFSRESLVSSLKSLGWVAPLTVLIWIYAEREQLSTLKNFSIPFEIKSSDPRQVITVLRPDNAVVSADVRGPRARLDQLRDLFSARGTDAAARIEIDPRNIGVGRQTIGAERIEADPRFQEYGIDLNNIQPRLIEIEVDELVDRQVDVRVPENVPNLAGAVFEPNKIKVTVPKSQLDKLRGAPLVAYADFASVPQIKTPGRHEKVPVRVIVPAVSRAQLATPTVNATFEVRQTETSYTIDAIPLSVSYARSVEDQGLRAELSEDSIPSVTVIGPAETIRAIKEAIEKGDLADNDQPKAILEVIDDNAPEGTPRSRAPRYLLPPGVRVSPEDAKRTVEFSLVRRRDPSEPTE